MIGCAGYVADSLSALLFPVARPILAPITNAVSAIGELPFVLWIIIRGAGNPARNEVAPEPA